MSTATMCPAATPDKPQALSIRHHTAYENNTGIRVNPVSLMDPTSRHVLLGYSALYLLNSLYCCYESASLLFAPCTKGDFSSGSSQRGFFFLLFLCGNIARFAWLVIYSSYDVVDGTPNSAGIYSITNFLRQVPELFFLAAYSFLGAYFGQVFSPYCVLYSVLLVLF